LAIDFRRQKKVVIKRVVKFISAAREREREAFPNQGELRVGGGEKVHRISRPQLVNYVLEGRALVLARSGSQ
jgi:hypothetical protein